MGMEWFDCSHENVTIYPVHVVRAYGMAIHELQYFVQKVLKVRIVAAQTSSYNHASEYPEHSPWQIWNNIASWDICDAEQCTSN